MNMQTRFIALKKFSALVGIAGASVLISSFPAWSQSAPTSGTSGETSTQIAQDSTSSGTGSEIELSPQGLEILCERFPLNSRCNGSAGSTGTSGTGTSGSGGLTPRSTPGSLDSNPSSDGGMTAPGTEVTPPGSSTYPGDTTTPGGTMSPGTMPPGGMTPPYTRPDGGMTAPGATPPGQPGDTTSPGSLTPPPSTRPGSGTGSFNSPSSGPSSGTSSPRSLAPKSQLKQDGNGASPSAPSSTTQPSAGESSTPSTTSETAPGNAETNQAEISDAELQQFANVIPKLQEVERSAQQQLSRAIADAGISQQRFSELYSAQQAPTAGQSSATANPATPEERESFNQVLSQIQTINQQVQSQKVNILQSEGLQPQQFNRILAAVQQDPSLQQQVQQLINN